MHILLTDLLTCPRCGPEFGLIILADSMAGRSVTDGRLGCANCRNEYPIVAGVADLRFGDESPGGAPAGAPERLDSERAFRLAALLGVGERSGAVMIHGAHPEGVDEIARLLPNAQVFGAGFSYPSGGSGGEASWIVHGLAVPLRESSLLAAAFVGHGSAPAVPAAAPKVFPGGHIVLDGVPSSALPRGGSEEWSVLLEQDGVAVASRTRAG